jgi:DNA-binding response OmpR family regulator
MNSAIRILVIEDDDNYQRLVSLALVGQGYEVRTASDGATGIELVDSFKPNLILLDIQMPVMSGEAFLEVYLRRPAPRPPVIAMTASSHLDNVIEMGVDDFITKPFDIETLLAHVKRYMRTAHI